MKQAAAYCSGYLAATMTMAIAMAAAHDKMAVAEEKAAESDDRASAELFIHSQATIRATFIHVRRMFDSGLDAIEDLGGKAAADNARRTIAVSAGNPLVRRALELMEKSTET